MIDLEDLLSNHESRSVEIPQKCGKVLSICQYQNLLVLACENGVWTYNPAITEFRKVYSGELPR